MEQAKPVLDRKAAEQMNLNVIKRIDPDVEEMLANAAHVALYDFDIPTKKWSRKDVEGSLFLVKRRSQPRFRFIILNKKSEQNYIEDVTGGFQCEINKPYCLYRSQEGGVIGIWFYEEADCNRISSLLQRISSTFAAPSEAPAGLMPNSPPTAQVSAQSMPSTVTAIMSGVAGGDNGEEETVGGGDFWDKKVSVPEDLPAPGAGKANGGSEMSGGQNPFTAVNGGRGDNALAKVFAGMKVATTAAPVAQQHQQAQQQQQAPMTLPLLTPQFLQQQAQQAPPPAAPVQMAPAPSAGAALLEGLRGGISSTSSVLPPPAAPAGASDGDAGRKVQALLRALSGNPEFCITLAGEMKRAGLL